MSLFCGNQLVFINENKYSMKGYQMPNTWLGYYKIHAAEKHTCTTLLFVPSILPLFIYFIFPVRVLVVCENV